MTLTSLLILTVAVNPTLSIEVDGDGYLRFSRDARAVYARQATLKVTEGKLTNAYGDPVLPTISVPSGSQKLDVDLEGTVYAITGSNKAKVGKFVLAMFPEGTALSEDKGVLIAADRPKLANPGEGLTGVVRVSTGAKGSTKTPESTTPKQPDQKPIETTVKETKIPDTKESDTKIPEIKTQEVKRTETSTSEVKIQEGQKQEVKTEGGSSIEVKTPQTSEKKSEPKINVATLAPHTALVSTKDTAEIVDDKFYVSDIAEIGGDIHVVSKIKGIEVGTTPMLGVKRTIDRTFLLGKIRAAGIKTEQFILEQDGPITVTRKGQTIEHSKFVMAATEAIKKSPGVSVEYKTEEDLPNYIAPEGRYTLVVEAISGINTQTVTAVVAIYLEDPSSTNSGSNWGKLPGFRRLNSRTLRFQAASSPTAVQQGRPIKVVMKAGGAMVELNGTAKSSGPVGASVSVEVRAGSPEVRTMHTGIVTAPGQVEVRI